MAILPILRYPDPRLATIAKDVPQVDAQLQTLIDDMFATMYAANGIGLAATQVNQHIRLVVMDLSEERNLPLVLINPRITQLGQERAKGKEGCLSVPDIHDEVERSLSLTVEALDRQGKTHTLNAEGLLAICIQHELDHLNGRVFVQYLSKLKQDRIITKLRKSNTQQAA
jgi:peptide deformylase